MEKLCRGSKVLKLYPNKDSKWFNAAVSGRLESISNRLLVCQSLFFIWSLFELICPDQGMGSNSCCRSIRTQKELTLQNHDLLWFIQNTFYPPNTTQTGGVVQLCYSRIQNTQKLSQEWQIYPIWVINMGL